VQLLFSGAIPGPSEPRGVTGLLAVLDTESGEIVHRCEYTTPDELRGPDQKMQLTGFAWVGESLYVCSHTEIVRFDEWPPTRPAGRLSLPGFNDLHHCRPWAGGIAVANTGLETVDLLSLEGSLEERWDLVAGREGARTIDEDLDYRRIADTKPHLVHVNHLFEHGGELWCTQLGARRAVPVARPEAGVEIEAGMPHDGRLVGDTLAFTTVNGYVVGFDPASMNGQRAVDLSAITPELGVLGWCRGICGDPRSPGSAFVGFTTPRRTAWREYAFSVKYGHRPAPSRICLYDLAEGRLERTYSLQDDLVIFQLDILPPERSV
jgi:hypothetical protein